MKCRNRKFSRILEGMAIRELWRMSGQDLGSSSLEMVSIEKSSHCSGIAEDEMDRWKS